ncbi:MAG: extracellular solute-binding protein [Clostridia bacterium]|nr:extracellular solute-binding protein [Clostridia bacterium]
MTKRIFALLLCGLMALSLVACGQKTTETKIDETKNQFLIVGGMSVLSSGNDSNPVLVDLAEKAGVEIEWDLMSDSLGEKVGVLIGGNQLPDAFIAVGFSQNDINEYGGDGTFIDLTPYITPEIMPNLCAIFEKHPDIKAGITQADGKIYGLPSGELMGTAAIGATDDLSIYAVPEFSMINKTWLDKLGLPIPTNLTELHDTLKAFKDNDMAGGGATIPMSTGYDQWCWGQEIFYAGFGFTNFTSDICFDLLANPDGTVQFVSATKAYRDAVTYFHDWYAEGLMDLEMFSQSTSQLISKVSQGRVGLTTWWEIKEIAGDHTDDFVFLPPMYGPQGTEYAQTRNLTIRSGPGVTSGNLNVTSACANPTLLLKYFDQWYDPETVMQLQYGPIGIYFSEKDANGVWQVIDDAAAKEKYGKSAGELKGQYEVFGPRLILAEYYNNVFAMEDRAVERLHQIEEYWMPYVQSPVYYPNDVTFTDEELETIKRYKADFVSQVAEYEGTWLKNGGPTDAEWDAYLKMLEDNCGMSRLLDVYQSAYTRYLKSK